jgi:pimeloyl-ACP methyl ester carboxylesterase
MSETPGFFPARDGAPLYGVYHAPAGGDLIAPDRVPGRPVPVLIAPGLLEERKSAYAVLARLAGALAAAGHPVLRFDFRGSGESGGDPAARRWAHLSEDLAAAREALLRLSRRPSVALVGLRLGAALVLREAAALAPSAVVALAPILKGSTEVRLWRVRSKMRAELTGSPVPGNSGTDKTSCLSPDFPGAALDLDGFTVAPEFLDDVARLDLTAPSAPLPAPALIVQVSHRETPAPEHERLVAALGPKARLACLRLEPFWDRVDEVDAGPLHATVREFLRTAGTSGSP